MLETIGNDNSMMLMEFGDVSNHTVKQYHIDTKELKGDFLLYSFNA